MATTHARKLESLGAKPSESSAQPARLEGITWSYSRRSTLERCPRQYYFEYFGGGKRTAKTEADKEQIRFLKKLANRHERTGSILHLVIAWSLRQAQRADPPSLDRLITWARQLFKADRAYSRRYPDGGGVNTQDKHPPILLREYHYHQVDVEQLCDAAEERLVAGVQAFAADPLYASFRVAGSTPGSLIEQPLKLRHGHVPCRIDGRIDLAYASAGSTTIVDWKLGEGSGSGEDSLQLASYALWAIEHFGCDLSSLRICKAHLTSREIIEFPVHTTVLAATRARIIQDAIRMVAVQRYGESGVADAFTPCAHSAVCSSCAFQRLCPEGRQFSNA